MPAPHPDESPSDLGRRFDLQERRDESLVTLGLTLASLTFDHVEDVCDTILSLVVSENGAAGGAILLGNLSDDGLPLHDTLQPAAQSGLRVAGPLPVEGPWRGIVRDLTPANVSAAEPDALPGVVPHRSGGRLLALPVISRGDSIGVLVLQLAAGSDHDDASLMRTLRIVSSIAAMSVMNVRNRAAERVLRAEVERQAQAALRDAEALRVALDKVEQELAIRSLSSPIIRVWDGVIALPVIGQVDADRAADMTGRLLEQVVSTGARIAVIDLTGVEHVDTHTTSHLLRLGQSVKLLGARCVMAGVTARVAAGIVHLGVDLGDTITFGDLRSALSWAMHELGYQLSRPKTYRPRNG